MPAKVFIQIMKQLLFLEDKLNYVDFAEFLVYSIPGNNARMC